MNDVKAVAALVLGAWVVFEFMGAHKYGVPMFSQQLRQLRAQDF